MIIQSFIYFTLGILIAWSTPLISMHESQQNPESMHFFDDIDDFLLEDEDPFIGEFLDTVGAGSLRQSIPPETIIRILLDTIGEDNLTRILTQDFFIRTNQLVRRSPLDQPLFEPNRCGYIGNWVIGTHIFARKTARSNFTANSTKISSYLALQEPTLIETLQMSIDQLQGLFPNPIDVKKIFDLFENMTVEERQGGFMFHLKRKWRRAKFRLLVPIYYFERNFFLNDQERKEVEAEFGVLEPEEQEHFQKAHFISDKLGLGDTRAELDFKIIKKPSFTIRGGIQTTIPTAFTLAREFKGTDFPEPCSFPTFDFDELFNLASDDNDQPSDADKEQAFNLLSDFILGALDRLAANLIEAKLGNDSHFGFGIYMRSKAPLSAFIAHPLAKRFTFANRISIEYLAPAHDTRFFINKINPKEFEGRDFEDTNKAEENLTFLEEKFVERIFLRAFKVRIQPGVIFRWTSRLCYQGKIWGFNVGTDWWVQDKEKFREIDAPLEALKEIDIQKAKGLFAWQSKLFGGIVGKIKKPRRTWFLSLNADANVNSRGIGHNYGISFNFEATF